MLEKLLFYLHGFQRYEFYNVILLRSTLFREKRMQRLLIQIEILSSAAAHMYSTLNVWALLRQNVQMRSFLAR